MRSALRLGQNFPEPLKLISTHFSANETKPHTVVNSGALSDVDYCESHPEEAEETNVLAPQKLAEACRKIKHSPHPYIFRLRFLAEKRAPPTQKKMKSVGIRTFTDRQRRGRKGNLESKS